MEAIALMTCGGAADESGCDGAPVIAPDFEGEIEADADFEGEVGC